MLTALHRSFLKRIHVVFVLGPDQCNVDFVRQDEMHGAQAKGKGSVRQPRMPEGPLYFREGLVRRSAMTKGKTRRPHDKKSVCEHLG